MSIFMESWAPNLDFGKNSVFAVRKQLHTFRAKPTPDSDSPWSKVPPACLESCFFIVCAALPLILEKSSRPWENAYRPRENLFRAPWGNIAKSCVFWDPILGKSDLEKRVSHRAKLRKAFPSFPTFPRCCTGDVSEFLPPCANIGYGAVVPRQSSSAQGPCFVGQGALAPAFGSGPPCQGPLTKYITRDAALFDRNLLVHPRP